MSFDQKFLSFSDMRRYPLPSIYIFFPTVLFSLISLFQFLRGRTWPTVSFTAGLIGTGLFHQYVVGFSYGNPDYMMPAGHMAAPLVSIMAYSITFIVAWAIARGSQSKRGNSSEDKLKRYRSNNENPK